MNRRLVLTLTAGAFATFKPLKRSLCELTTEPIKDFWYVRRFTVLDPFGCKWQITQGSSGNDRWRRSPCMASCLRVVHCCETVKIGYDISNNITQIPREPGDLDMGSGSRERERRRIREEAASSIGGPAFLLACQGVRTQKWAAILSRPATDARSTRRHEA